MVAGEKKLLTCPIRGQLNASALAKDGLTITEEARRIEFLRFLLKRGYPKQNIGVETVILKSLGESGRNKLRCDAIVYDEPVRTLDTLPFDDRLAHAMLVAEIKRDSAKKTGGVKFQLEPALRQLPGLHVLGVYWDDVTRKVFAKAIQRKNGKDHVDVAEDGIENLPRFGALYKAKPVTLDETSPPDNLVSILYNVANVMRSNGVNDEHVRYKETVKLILARYCDERDAATTRKKELALQVLPGMDRGFLDRVQSYYVKASKRYSRAKTLFQPSAKSALNEKTLRDVVRLIQGISFSQATNEVMQQVFMSFVPAVFKKSLDQYFTPLSLINCMVEMVDVRTLDNIADPGMGTGDFLTAALQKRLEAGDSDITQRLYGFDVDEKAYDLAVINMILHKDGQGNMLHGDSIKDVRHWADEMQVVLCNPPFGEKSIETRPDVLAAYDLGHVWLYDESQKLWKRTEHILATQQLGIMFLERCYKLLDAGGRLAIILPEGYMCTPSYGYVRQWIVEHFRVISLVELPRRIFLKSDADLRASILVAQKLKPKTLKSLIAADYPIHAELVRKVGYKLGGGFSPLPQRDPETGTELRDDGNRVLIDSDFSELMERYKQFSDKWKWNDVPKKQIRTFSSWKGGRISDVLKHPNLDLKARRLTYKALENRRTLLKAAHVRLGDIADVVEQTIDIGSDENLTKQWRLVEGEDIDALQGTVFTKAPIRGWEIAERKGNSVFVLGSGDIIVGLVRPERRNVGMLISGGNNMVGSPDGIAVVRVKPDLKDKYSQEWLFSILRSESSRLQFWTESGGTSYGKLTPEHVQGVLIPGGATASRNAAGSVVREWLKHSKATADSWTMVGNAADRVAIINSPLFGLESDDFD